MAANNEETFKPPVKPRLDEGAKFDEQCNTWHSYQIYKLDDVFSVRNTSQTLWLFWILVRLWANNCALTLWLPSCPDPVGYLLLWECIYDAFRSRDKKFHLIELYRQQPCLWNGESIIYKDRYKRVAVLKNIWLYSNKRTNERWMNLEQSPSAENYKCYSDMHR